MQPNQQECWYRYHDTVYSNGGIDECGEWKSSGPGTVKIGLIELPVLKYTPKGVWVGWNGSWKRFVLASATKRYACPTKAEALESFIARKKRQRSILSAQLDRASKALDLARTPGHYPI